MGGLIVRNWWRAVSALLQRHRYLVFATAIVAGCAAATWTSFGDVARLTLDLAEMTADDTGGSAMRTNAEALNLAVSAERYARTGDDADFQRMSANLDALFVRRDWWLSQEGEASDYRADLPDGLADWPTLKARLTTLTEFGDSLIAAGAPPARYVSLAVEARETASAFFGLDAAMAHYRTLRSAEIDAALALAWNRLTLSAAGFVMSALALLIVTARRIDSLARSERRYVTAIEAASDGVFDWDLASNQVFHSPRNLTLLGLTVEEVKRGGDAGSLWTFFRRCNEALWDCAGNFWRPRIHPDDWPTAQAAIEALLRDDARYDITYRIRHADGSWRWWRSRGEAVRDARGAPIRMIGVNSDVTALLEAERRAAQSDAEAASLAERLEAEQANSRLQRQFVAMVSHEFRTPLSIMDGRARQLSRRAARDLPPGGAVYFHERCRDIRVSVGRLIELIESILTAARYEEGQIECRPEPMALNALCAELAGATADMNPERTVRTRLAPECEKAVCDPVLLRQVVSNLLSNAAKYSDDGGRILLETRRDDDAGEFRIGVTDSGVGIPEDEVAQLSQRFFRASTASGRPGTGLGLHLITHFLALHGGRVEVRSRVGEGSTFTAAFPIGLAAAERSAA
ncbi:sensor histidine kinase [Rubrimonas cliftonensis]|uniref:histidine kinase n=1 Tax=Rubrimonas cliftonensis TaxID=89524 RepID=A0A1H4CFL6_9RHOB|nr:HAMP domain-containing sensor histidine kinase [Rubrimonas cliftonensis]SEA59148.1 PAS domain S-box-containing protein [Rubrimonas cliftonensis]